MGDGARKLSRIMLLRLTSILPLLEVNTLRYRIMTHPASSLADIYSIFWV